MEQELAFATVAELRQLIDAKQVSIVELTELFLRRIERLNPRLNAYLTVSAEEALAAARAAQEVTNRGWNAGPLHGIPVSIKDLEMTRGIRATLGSLIFKDRVPDYDSALVERVRKAGAIILGKTNTPEFGQSGTTENRLGDACRNPWDTARTAGGSSGGAGAALAAGLCILASGSDAGGSIRIPASFCGVFGVKPTQGRVARYGGYGRPAANHFSNPGPMARTVADCAQFLQVISGPDPRDASSLRETPPDFSANLRGGVKGWRVAWSADLGFAAVDPEVKQATEKAAQVFAGLGATVEEAKLQLENPLPAWIDLFYAGTYTSYGHLLEQHGEELSEYGRRAIEHGAQVSGADYSQALAQVQRFQWDMEGFFGQFDLLLTPAMAVTAFPIGQRPQSIGGQAVESFWGYTPFSVPFNVSGQPAASVPCGFSKEGLPIGLQVAGPKGAEARTLQACAAFEEALPWRHKLPPIS